MQAQRLILLSLVAASWLAGGAHAASVTCDVIDAPDSITTKCPKAATPVLVPVPVVPVVPVDPTPPPPDPAPVICPPNLSQFLCNMWLSNPIGSSTPPAPGPGPAQETVSDPTFIFRCGSLRRIYGDGDSKSLLAARDASIGFSIGESGLNETQRWHITIAIAGRVVSEYDFIGVYDVTPPFPIKAGQGASIAVRSNEPGKKISVSIRLSVDGC
jgi:hypothetical protein